MVYMYHSFLIHSSADEHQLGCMRQVLGAGALGRPEGSGREGGGRGFGMGNTCKSMADSCQCMTKTTTICKVISLQLIKKLIK